MERRGTGGIPLHQLSCGNAKQRTTRNKQKRKRRVRKREMGPIRIRRGAVPVPKEFLCPISGKFMCDPVILHPNGDTCDRSSIASNSMADDAQPNLILREKICAWISQDIRRHFAYKLHPPFAFISTETHLRPAFESLKQCDTIDDALPFLTRLNKAIRLLDPAVLNRGGLIALRYVGDLLAKRDLPRPWVIHAVSILANASEIEMPNANLNNNYGEFQLENIGRRIYGCGISNFQLGFVNLMHALALTQNSVLSAKIGQSYGIIEALVSYVWPIPRCLARDGMYQKLLDTLYDLSALECNCCRVARAGAVGRIFNLLEWPDSLDVYHVYAFNIVLGERGRIAAVESGMKILQRLCNTEVGCAGMMKMSRALHIYNFCDALFNHVERPEALAAGLSVLVHILRYSELVPILRIVEARLLLWEASTRGADQRRGTVVVRAIGACFAELRRIQVQHATRSPDL